MQFKIYTIDLLFSDDSFFYLFISKNREIIRRILQNG